MLQVVATGAYYPPVATEGAYYVENDEITLNLTNTVFVFLFFI